jgi:hypothetical protein
LTPKTNELLQLLNQLVDLECERLEILRADHELTIQQMLDFTGWPYRTLRDHLGPLEEQEFLVLLQGGGRGQLKRDRLTYGGEGQGGRRFVLGLDVSELPPASADMAEFLAYLKSTVTKHAGPLVENAGQNGENAGPMRQVGGDENTRNRQ